MLFVENKFLNLSVGGFTRVELLDGLREEGFSPIIQSMRRSSFEAALSLPDEVSDRQQRLAAEVWQLVAQKIGAEGIEQYVRGDLFSLEDFMLFLNFDDAKDGNAGTGAGIVFTRDTKDPLQKLDNFCRAVTRVLSPIRQRSQEDSVENIEWHQRAPCSNAGYGRFISKQDKDFLSTAPRRETLWERQRAATFLEDDYLRHVLCRMREAAVEGYTSKLLPGTTGGIPAFPVGELTEAGLLSREIVISCRKTGHALFQLPSADALAVITVGKAKCSECGALVADERIGEVIAPTELALSLLEDASWLINRVYSIVRKLGVLPTDLVLGPVNAYGEAHLIANMCGQVFLFVLRDGDLTPSVARRAVDAEIETEAAHLLIIISGKALNESRMFLMDHARRRARGGGDLEVSIIEDMRAVESEICRAFEKVSQSAINENLCHLDDNFGLSVSRMVLSRFEALRGNTNGGNYRAVSTDPPSTEAQEVILFHPPAI